MASPVTIVGGGWAGLATAIELTRQGVPVSLLESARTCGGRARSVDYRGAQLDNGQHLFIGGYHQTLRLLKICGVDPSKMFKRAPLHFPFYGHGIKRRSIRLPRLPAPVHMSSGILLAEGMDWSTKWQLIGASLRFMLKGFKIKRDCSVDELLQQAGQDDATIKALWEPLCLATLNTPTHIASAEIFLKVLQDSFTRSYKDSDTLLARCDLSQLFVAPAIRYIESHGGKVESSTRVNAVEITDDKVGGLMLNERAIESQTIVLATPPLQSAQLLSSDLSHRSLALERLIGTLQQFEYQPIITLYLQYDESAQLPHPFIGFDDSLTQWLFDRRHCGQAGMMAAVISAEGAHTNWSREQLTRWVTEEVASHFPELGEIRHSWLIHEKRATFAATVGINRVRPGNQTAVKGLWLAGDYTATGYPATLEGALISGVESARKILENS